MRLAEGAVKTPDYEIRVDDIRIAVEVKQVEPSAEDRSLLEQAARGELTSYWVDMFRARQRIRDGVKQLRAHSKGRQPAMVVLYEVAGPLGYLDSDSVAQCLYGPEEVRVAVSEDPSREPWVLGGSRGGGRVATEQDNTTLSAVAVLRTTGECETLSVFHNAFAVRPIEPHRFRFEGVRHFVWRAPDPMVLPRWVDVTPTTA